MSDSYVEHDSAYREHDDPEKNTSNDTEGSGYFYCGVLMFVISTVCYCVTMGVGWALSRDVVPDDHTALAAAVISTIPVFAAGGYIYFMMKFGRLAEEWGVGTEVKQCSFGCLFCIELFAAVFEVIGGLIFVVVGVGVEDNRIKAFGFSAATFGFLSACSCCCGLCCCCCQFSNDC